MQQAARIEEVNGNLDTKIAEFNRSIQDRLAKQDEAMQIMRKDINENHEITMKSFNKLLESNAKKDQQINAFMNTIQGLVSKNNVLPSNASALVSPMAKGGAVDLTGTTTTLVPLQQVNQEEKEEVYVNYATDSYGQVNALLRANEQ